MTAILCPPIVFQGLTPQGLPLVGGLLNSYVAGTSTPQATYTDSTMGTPNLNPVKLNASGQAAVWLDPTKVYKFILTDALGNTVDQVDQVQGSLTASVLFLVLGLRQTPAEAAAGITPVNLQYAPGTVDRYQTNTIPGITLMIPGITAAIAVVKQQGGGRIVFLDGFDYFVGNFSTGFQPQGVFNITGAANMVFTGRARIVSNTSSTALPYIFYCKDCNQMTWDGLRAIDTGFVIGEIYQGPVLVVATTSTSTDSGGYTLRDVEVQNIISPFIANKVGGGSGRVRGIHFQNLKVDSCTYGPAFQENGDGAWGRISCNNVMRVYFPYGISGHDITMDVWHDSIFQGSNACVDIKRYLNDTSGIKLRVHFHGSVVKYGALVNFETQGTLANLGITKFGAITGGTLYTDGFYAQVPLTGGTGTGATANLQSFGGAIVWAEICSRGNGYLTTDTLSASNANMGGTGSGFSVAIAAVGATIFGCDIDIDLSGAPFADPVVVAPVQFRSLTPGGATNATTTDVWDAITLRGNLGDWATEQPGETPQAISVLSVQTGRPGRLHLGGDQYGNFGGTPQWYPGFVVRTSADTEVYTKIGDLTAAAVFIDLNRYDGHPFALRIVIHGALNWADGANASNLEYILTGRKFGGNVPTLSTTTAGFSSTVGTTTVPTFTPSGTGINVTFTNYNNAQSYLKMSVQSLARLT